MLARIIHIKDDRYNVDYFIIIIMNFSLSFIISRRKWSLQGAGPSAEDLFDIHRRGSAGPASV